MRRSPFVGCALTSRRGGRQLAGEYGARAKARLVPPNPAFAPPCSDYGAGFASWYEEEGGGRFRLHCSSVASLMNGDHDFFQCQGNLLPPTDRHTHTRSTHKYPLEMSSSRYKEIGKNSIAYFEECQVSILRSSWWWNALVLGPGGERARFLPQCWGPERLYCTTWFWSLTRTAQKVAR